MQADMLWGELQYQHVASDMGSGPQGRKACWELGKEESERDAAEHEEGNLHMNNQMQSLRELGFTTFFNFNFALMSISLNKSSWTRGLKDVLRRVDVRLKIVNS